MAELDHQLTLFQPGGWMGQSMPTILQLVPPNLLTFGRACTYLPQ